MSQARYERLMTEPRNQQDEHDADYDTGDGNEEIELGMEQHHHKKHQNFRYQPLAAREEQLGIGLNDEDDDEAELFDAAAIGGGRYVNGHVGNSGSAMPKDSVHHESGLIGDVTAGHAPASRFMQMAIGTLATIMLYLTLSICLTFYQKALTQKMRFPFSIVTYHLVIKFFLSASVRAVYRCRMGKTRVQLDWRTSLRKMAPTGIASGIDIGFSNWGLELVPVSLYTMTKSSTIVFILFFAILLGLEKKSWLLVFIVGLIAIGLFMFTYKSTQFDALGFTCILIASLSSGVRWSFAQFVMQKSKLGLHNPIDMIFHMQPWMIASLLPFLVACEGQMLYDVLIALPETPVAAIYYGICAITFGALLAFLMEVSEFMVLSQTSSLTLSITGIFKDICQVALAVELNGDQLSLINVSGLAVCLAGICCHLIHKYSTLTKLEELQALENDSLYSETSVGAHWASASGGAGGNGNNGGASGASGSSGHNHTFVLMRKQQHAAQSVPLLEQTDSDEDSMNHESGHEQSASEVIFDVLKRRDVQR